MASTAGRVSLPSINEMFPEHMMTGWYTDGGDGAAARPRSSSQATDAPAPGPATHGRPRAASSAAQPYDLRTAGGSGLAAHDARPTSSPAYDLPHAQSVPPHAPPHAPQYAPDMRPRAYSSGAQDPRFAHEVRFQSGLARPPSFAAPPHAAPAPHGAPPHAYDVPHAGPSFRVAVPAAPAVPAAHDPRAYEAQGYAPFAEPLPLSPAGAPGEEKKHSCPHCLKRFNRPSSLSIHVNTHTGAKPFQCPYPGCHRKFNVNSNMRRHWRNHMAHERRRDAVARLVDGAPPSPLAASPAASAYAALPAQSPIHAHTPAHGHGHTDMRSYDGVPAVGRQRVPPTPPLSFSPASSPGSRSDRSLPSSGGVHNADDMDAESPYLSATEDDEGEDEDVRVAERQGGYAAEGYARGQDYGRGSGRVRSRSSPVPVYYRRDEGRVRASSCSVPGCGGGRGHAHR